MSARSQLRSRLTRGRVFALLSGGLVLGLGATATLASWSDNEWVYGGVDGATPGIGTSSFEVEQSRNGTTWDQFETSNGGVLTLDAKALSLTPGDATYTQVSLRTLSAPASVAGKLNLLATTQAVAPQPTSDAGLWAALRLRVVVTDGTPTACTVAQFSSTATYVVGTFAGGGVVLGTTPATLDRPLSAAAANQQNYCFEVTLPAGVADTLQGKKVTPAWQFHAESL